jgi:hypothetical protein
MFAYTICSFSCQVLPLLKASMPEIFRKEKTDLLITGKAMDFLIVPKRENMLWFIFISANVKNITSYLKTNL